MHCTCPCRNFLMLNIIIIILYYHYYQIYMITGSVVSLFYTIMHYTFYHIIVYFYYLLIVYIYYVYIVYFSSCGAILSLIAYHLPSYSCWRSVLEPSHW